MKRKIFLIFGIFFIFGILEIVLPPKTIVVENKEISSFSKETQKEKSEKTKQQDMKIIENITIIAVGDIMLSRWVAKEILKNNDYRYPFLKTADILKDADLTFGNLESPITSGREILINEMHFRADPEATSGLEFAGFDVLSLANNHFGDFGRQGMTDTFKFLEEKNIDFTGAGKNRNEAHTVLIKEVKGKKIGFLAYSDSNFTSKTYEAGEKEAGIALMNAENLETDIKKAKKETDFLVVSMHAGKEYQQLPTSWQEEFAHTAVDCGADLVFGHHPHILQPYEKYKGKYIFYSLGNFVFDQDTPKETKESIILKLVLDYSSLQVEKLETTPISIKKYSQPKVAAENKVDILKNFCLIEK